MSARSIVRAHRRRVAAGVVGAAASAAIAAAPASAATFPVTSNNAEGVGSLAEAVDLANASAAADTITFASNVTGTITVSADLEVTDALTIQGPGASVLTVSGGDATRIFDATPAAFGPATRMPFNISGLTLADANTTELGGAVYGTHVDFSISDSVLTGNETSSIGGALEFEDSKVAITGVRATGNDGANGGGVLYTDGSGDAQSTDTVTITNSTFTGNTTNNRGGVFYFDNGTGGDVRIVRSTLAGNDANNDGGAILFYGHQGSSIVRQSTISGNSAGDSAGGIYWNAETSYVDDQPLIIENSTINGNEADRAGGVYIYNDDDDFVTINNSTIVGNTATTDTGGIYRRDFDVDISSSIVAGNTAPTNPDLGEFVSATQAFEAGNSIVGVVGDAFIQETPAGTVQFGVDPQLGPLANNGGPTLTLLPAKTSPAIDKGVANGLTEDQRGLARTSYAGTDIGAVELQPPVTPPPPDTSVAGPKLNGKKTQKQKGKKVVVKVSAGAAEQVDLVASGQIKLGKKKFALKPVATAVPAATSKTLSLKPKKKSANKKILVNPKKAKASVKVVFTDAAGNTATQSLKVKLK